MSGHHEILLPVLCLAFAYLLPVSMFTTWREKAQPVRVRRLPRG